MSVQSTVSLAQGFGVIGEIYTDSPIRAVPYTLVSASAAYNVFGRGFSVTSEGIAEAGNSTGSKVFAGILISPKTSALRGDSSNPLNSSLVLPNNSPAELLNMGEIIVYLPAAANIGDLVVMDNTTGALSTIVPGADLPTGKSPAYAVVSRFNVSAAGLAVILVTTTPQIPVLAA